MFKQYSLLDYSMSITPKIGSNTTINIPIGGVGSYLGSIKTTKHTDNIKKTVDATGSGVFGFSNDHSGSLDIELSQVANTVAEIIKQVANAYHITSEDEESWKKVIVDITLYKGNQAVVEATSCMLVKMPDLSQLTDVGTRTFSFLSMEIKELPITY